MLYETVVWLGIVLQSVLATGLTAEARVDWCTAGVQGSPLEINVPNVMHIPFNLGMNFTNRADIRLKKIENNHLLYTGDLGSLTYLEARQVIERVDVFSPSLHMLYGVVYPLEVQVKARSEVTGGYITLSYLFEKLGTQAHPFLSAGWMRENKVKNLPPSDVDYPLENDFSLMTLVDNKQGFAMYEGTSLVGNCEKTMYFVSNELSYLSETQLNELIPLAQMKNTQARPLGLLLYQNFRAGWGVHPKKWSSSVALGRFPSSIMNGIDMYQPDSVHQVGFIPSNFIPGWLQPNGTVHWPVLDKPPSGMKYLVYCYEPLGDGTFVPRYIPVPPEYSFTPGIQPNTVEVFIRTQEQAPNGIREIIKLPMPVQWTPLNESLIQEQQKEKVKQQEEAKIAQVRAQVKVDIQKKEEALRVQAMKERIKKNIIFKRVCEEWTLENIVNRHHNNDDAWQLKDLLRGGDQDLLVCKRWRVVRENDDGKDVDEEGNVIPPPAPAPAQNPDGTKTTNGTKATKGTVPVPGNKGSEQSGKREGGPDPRLGPVRVDKCGNYILVVMNQRFRNKRIRDYILDQCKDWKSVILPRATALARREGGLSAEELQELAEGEAHLLQTEHTPEQQVLSPLQL